MLSIGEDAAQWKFLLLGGKLRWDILESTLAVSTKFEYTHTPYNPAIFTFRFYQPDWERPVLPPKEKKNAYSSIVFGIAEN